MPASDKVFAGSVPENYDRYLVPLIFQAYADDMAKRIALRSPKSVLETAAGSGVVTRAVAAILPPDAAYTATDLNPPMLDHAQRRQADAQALPFEDRSFDIVCCQFGAMFFPDRIKAYREAKRVLKPQGVFIFSVCDRIEENIFADDVINALAELFPQDPPRFLARTPHGYHDLAKIRQELGESGFSDIRIETRPDQSRALSPRHAVIGFCQGSPLRAEIEARGDLAAATDHAARSVAARHGEGEISAKIQAHVIEAAA
jgi:ubiquinone/menaquinone biosynthesis C-methylase UbiE